jgi:hypothetical protein
MRVAIGLVAAIALTGCAIQRAQLSQDAKAQMIGKSKEQVLACMGIPNNKAVEGATEVWSYNSGNGYTEGTSVGSATLNRGYGYASLFGSSSSVSQSRFCTINVTMASGRVQQLNYTGPTGGLLTEGEQCAFVLQNCVQAR